MRPIALVVILLLRPAPGAAVELLVGGDLLAGRGVDLTRLRGLRSLHHGRHLIIVNLESPLAPCLSGGSVTRPRLCGDPTAATALKQAGIDAVTLANNHALDAGARGLQRTAAVLRRAGIVPLGMQAALTGAPRPESLGSLTVVAASLTPAAHAPGSTVGMPGPSDLARAVCLGLRRWASRPVLVLLHGGRELDPRPAPWEAAYVDAVVRAGAAAVVMHGAHVIRPLQRQRSPWFAPTSRVPVHLGLGNLLFDQRDPRARLGALLHLRFTRGRARVLGIACVDTLEGGVRPCPGETER